MPENASWVGLSEITRIPNSDDYLLIERDNRTGDFAALKTLVRISLSAMDDGVITRDEMRVFDLLPALRKTDGWVTDKPEGVAVTEDGQVYVMTVVAQWR